MKRMAKRKNEQKWYLIFDGKNHKITTDISEDEQMHTIIIELTAQQAAGYLLMRQTFNND